MICYLGDDDLDRAAMYLAGVMTHYGLAYDYVPSHRAPDEGFTSRPYQLYVLSDYPSARFRPGQMEHIVQRVRQGAGLAMLGGWESFFGRLGEYHDSPLAEALPVVMLRADDRRNCAQPCLVRLRTEHPLLAGLPWSTPPSIGGYNALTPKPEAQTLLSAVRFAASSRGNAWLLTPGEEVPLLVVGAWGQGRTAALATDVAPHWVGGMVDWGDRRVVQELSSGCIEVGNHYARFFRNLLTWTGRLTETQ